MQTAKCIRTVKAWIAFSLVEDALHQRLNNLHQAYQVSYLQQVFQFVEKCAQVGAIVGQGLSVLFMLLTQLRHSI